MTTRKIAFLTISVAMMIMLLAGALFGQPAPKGNLYRYLSIFSEVFDLVRSNYVEQVSSDQLMDGAFSGVTDAIDEFSYYVPPAQMPAYKSFTDVEDNKVGLVVTKRFGYAFVISPLAGSPAERAGVERGDFIDTIDGQATAKMPVWQIRSALATGKKVRLSVIRGGETKRQDVSIAPSDFHPLTLTTDTISGIGYIKIPYFEKGTAEQFRTALAEVKKRGTRKLIVDVRGNAGGDVNEAIAVADDLLAKGMITSLVGRKVETRKWQADPNVAFDGDLEVLTDTSTASGAEIFAAAIRGNERGKVVGVTTYGKAIMQRFIPLPTGGGVHMTVAHYTMPDAKPIKETGVRPDVIVDLSSQAIRDSKEEAAPPREKREDLILNKALALFGATPKSPALKKAA